MSALRVAAIACPAVAVVEFAAVLAVNVRRGDGVRDAALFAALGAVVDAAAVFVLLYGVGRAGKIGGVRGE